MGGLLTNIAGNVVKAIDAGQRIAKIRKARARRAGKNNQPKGTGKTSGGGRKRKKTRRRRKPRGVTMASKKRRPKSIKARNTKTRSTRRMTGNGVGRPRRRRVVRI